MCLGIPMQITTIDGYTAHCEARSLSDLGLIYSATAPCVAWSAYSWCSTSCMAQASLSTGTRSHLLPAVVRRRESGP